MATSFESTALWAQNPNGDPNAFSEIHCDLQTKPTPALKPDQVLIEAHYSSINYKDALAVTGRGKILRNLPLIPGIDVSGIVKISKSSKYKEGQKVLVTGCELGEKWPGGFSQYVVVDSENMIPLPEALSLREAMIYGTAGFTAALAIHQLEHNGLTPSKGEVLVTGATGGVGCISLLILKKLGYNTRAWTRKKELCDWLLDMGATSSESVKDKDFHSKPLASSQWAGAIDSVGGSYLSYILPRVQLWGSVASIGLAQSPLLQSTVFPFILRGVNLLGVSSNNCPRDLRENIWLKLATTYKPKNLADCVSADLELKDIPAYCQNMVEGKTKGRALVRLQ